MAIIHRKKVPTCVLIYGPKIWFMHPAVTHLQEQAWLLDKGHPWDFFFCAHYPPVSRSMLTRVLWNHCRKILNAKEPEGFSPRKTLEIDIDVKSDNSELSLLCPQHCHSDLWQCNSFFFPCWFSYLTLRFCCCSYFLVVMIIERAKMLQPFSCLSRDIDSFIKIGAANKPLHIGY